MPSHPLGKSTVLRTLGQPPYSPAIYEAIDKGPRDGRSLAFMVIALRLVVQGQDKATRLLPEGGHGGGGHLRTSGQSHR